MVSAAAALQVGDGVVQREVGPLEIDRLGLVPLLGLELVQWRPHAVDARVGEDDVEAAERADAAPARTG